MRSVLTRFRYGWDAARWVRLIIGLIVLIPAAFHADFLTASFGIWLTAMPLLGFGCCGGGACDVNHNVNREQSFPESEK